MRKILVVYGTRPEAIKLAPVINALKDSSFLKPVTAVTGQHRFMLDQVNSIFGIIPDHDLDIIRPRQTLQQITNAALTGVEALIEIEQPDAVMVQGDTTTCFASALASFYRQVPVIHLEAGLRTGETYNPFPEEMNRRLTSQLAQLHLAPTSQARDNLLRESINPSQIYVTGNTVIDALLATVAKNRSQTSSIQDNGERQVLITTHRRESWGEPMANAARAIARLAKHYPNVRFLLPAHLNPTVREVLLPPLTGIENVKITDPLPYGEFAAAIAGSNIILTDSGGVQEEAPSLGKPVLVMRDNTERPEAVEAGTVRLVGTDEASIFNSVSELLDDPQAYRRMARSVNPYGDGKATLRVAQAVGHFFGVSLRPNDFVPEKLRSAGCHE